MVVVQIHPLPVPVDRMGVPVACVEIGVGDDGTVFSLRPEQAEAVAGVADQRRMFAGLARVAASSTCAPATVIHITTEMLTTMRETEVLRCTRAHLLHLHSAAVKS
jgi:hypothetical protein